MRLQAMMIHLEPHQKQGLTERARAAGGSVSREIRTAVEQYLAGPAGGDLAVLDEATRRAERDLAEVHRDLAEAIAMVRGALAEVAALRGGGGPAQT